MQPSIGRYVFQFTELRIPHTRQETSESNLTVGRWKDETDVRPKGGMDRGGAAAKQVGREHIRIAD